MKQEPERNKPTAVTQYEQRIGRMIDLSAVQILMSVAEGDEAMAELTTIFKQVMSQLKVLEQEPEFTAESLSRAGETLRAGMSEALIAMQFYDRLTQRLSHTSATLQVLSHFLTQTNTDDWAALQEKVASMYTTPEEGHIHQMLMEGMTIEAIVRHFIDSDDNSTVELF